jgi:hypothetical protein
MLGGVECTCSFLCKQRLIVTTLLIDSFFSCGFNLFSSFERFIVVCSANNSAMKYQGRKRDLLVVVCSSISAFCIFDFG